MPTSVHIPPRLLEALDRRARLLGVSRNRVIVHALERELESGTQWSPGFFEALAEIQPGDADAIDDLVDNIRARRTAKAPPKL